MSSGQVLDAARRGDAAALRRLLPEVRRARENLLASKRCPSSLTRACHSASNVEGCG